MNQAAVAIRRARRRLDACFLMRGIENVFCDESVGCSGGASSPGPGGVGGLSELVTPRHPTHATHRRSSMGLNKFGERVLRRTRLMRRDLRGIAMMHPPDREPICTTPFTTRVGEHMFPILVSRRTHA